MSGATHTLQVCGTRGTEAAMEPARDERGDLW